MSAVRSWLASETPAARTTMAELHSNFTVEGSGMVIAGMPPTEPAEHETVEITRGVDDWAEVGFTFFPASRRRRMAAAKPSHPPAGVSLATEFR